MTKATAARKRDLILQIRADQTTLDRLDTIRRHGEGAIKSRAEIVRELIDKEWTALHPQKHKR